MTRLLMPVAILVLAVLTALPARAHHSHPYFYDNCRSVTVEGRIDRIEFKDPHSLIFLTLDDGAAYIVDWSGLRGLTRQGVIEPARADLTPGSRVSVTGNRIRTLAEIRKHFPDYDGQVDPNTLDPMAIRRIGGSFAWQQSGAGGTPDCTGR